MRQKMLRKQDSRIRREPDMNDVRYGAEEDLNYNNRDNSRKSREQREMQGGANRPGMATSAKVVEASVKMKNSVKAGATYPDGHPKYKIDSEGVKMGKYVFDE